MDGNVTSISDDVIEFWTTQKLESLNKFVGKTSEWPWKKYKTAWNQAICALVPSKDKKKIKAYTTIISYRNRLLDKENLYGGSKPIRDELQTLGWIYDDKPGWGDLTVLQCKVPRKEEKTVIRVWLDVEEES